MSYLFHYTTGAYLESILNEGYLRLSESNLTNWSKVQFDQVAYDQGKLKLYKPVVWMTELEEVELKNSLGLFSKYDKTEIKITIKKQAHYKKYRDWAFKNNIDKNWYRRLTQGFASNTWWVSDRIIPLDDIVKIENRYTGEIYYENEKYKI